MADYQPQYRFRGSVQPSAEIARPVAVRHNAAAADGSAGTSATLDIFDVIDSWGGWWGISARDVDAALKKVGEVDTLYVRVNSPGGEATEGVAIANLLRAHKAKVHVTVFGLAASAASYISTAGDQVTMAPGSMMMVHDAWNIALGSADELRAEAGVLDKLSDSIASLYALKAGGTADEWRAVMRAETWYTADETVAAKLADRVGIETTPDPVNADDLDAELAELVDALAGNDSAGAPALAVRAAARFDLSMFTRAPAALIGPRTQTPADQPVAPPTDHKEADTMSDTIPTAGLVKALGLPDDADEDTILEAVEAKVTASAAAPKDEKPAAPVIPDGKVLVSQTVLDELKAGAQAGVEARAKQLTEERDEAIQAAFSAGKISKDRVAAWTASWDKDPEGTKSDLESLPARFPVAKVEGYQGDDGSAGASAVFTDDQASALAALTGSSKEALLS